MQLLRLHLSSALVAIVFSLLSISDSVNASSVKPFPLKRFSHTSDISIDILTREDSSHSNSIASRHSHHRRSSSTTASSISSNPLLLSSSTTTTTSKTKRSNPNQVLSSDSLRLTLRAFSQTFHLHLQPNHELLHPDGTTVIYHETDQETGEIRERKEILHQGDVRAYHGLVLHPEYSLRRMNEDKAGVKRDIYSSLEEGVVGRAAILIHDDGSVSGNPSFEGSFDWLGNEHQIQTSRNYDAIRQQLDPKPERRSLESNRLLVHRSSDLMNEEQARSAGVDLINRSDDVRLGCSSDSKDFNLNNHLIMSGQNDDEFSFNPLSFFVARNQSDNLGKRSSTNWMGMFDGLLSRSDSPSETEIRNSKGEEFPQTEQGFDDEDSRYSYSLPNYFSKRQGGGDVLDGGSSTNDSFINDIGSTSGCPSTSMVVYVGIAADCTYSALNSSTGGTRSQILQDMNSVSNLYRSTFNVSIGVIDIDVRDPTCPTSASSDAPWNVGCDAGPSLDQRLSDFSSWRGNKDANGTGLWHLLTTCNSGSEVGVAWLGTLCQTTATGQGNNVVSGTGVTAATSREWQIIAHEMGHNFGAIHDCADGCSLGGNLAKQSALNGGATCCPLSGSTCSANAQFVMNPVSQQSVNSFSQCSIGNICSLLGRGLDTSCVVAPGGRTTLSERQCGNGIKEPGEECDAGPNGSQCCSTECKLTSGSVCDPSTQACCTDQCQLQSSGFVCRASKDPQCDSQETCSGTSADCPADDHKSDGESCGSGGLTCASGICTSRDQQCQEQGTSLNLQEACPSNADNSCSVSCRDPTRANSCIILQQNFIDGTSCGYGGKCRGGECKAGSWQDTFDNWYKDNLRISIPVTIVVGILVLAILYGIARCIFCRNRGRKSAPATYGGGKGGRNQRRSNPNQMSYNNAPPPPPQRNSQFNNYAPPPSHPQSFHNSGGYQGYSNPQSYDSSNGYSNTQSHYVDPSHWNGPPAPPPRRQGGTYV